MTDVFETIPMFALLCGIAVVAILLQIDTTIKVDELRWWHQADRWQFYLKRATMFLKAVALCWAVIYSEQHDWMPWPPLQFFLVAFILHVATAIWLMKIDLIRMKRNFGMSSIGRG